MRIAICGIFSLTDFGQTGDPRLDRLEERTKDLIVAQVITGDKSLRCTRCKRRLGWKRWPSAAWVASTHNWRRLYDWGAFCEACDEDEDWEANGDAMLNAVE